MYTRQEAHKHQASVSPPTPDLSILGTWALTTRNPTLYLPTELHGTGKYHDMYFSKAVRSRSWSRSRSQFFKPESESIFEVGIGIGVKVTH